VKIAVLGLGSAGSRHARNLLELGHEIVGFDPGAAHPPDTVARAHSAEEAVRSAEAVVVATPSALHAEHALLAVRLGKHVLVEKPVATSAKDAEEIADAADRAGVTCAVAMNLRFHPPLEALKRLVDEGRLGTPYLAETAFGYDLRLWRPGTDYRESYSARADLGGGILLDAVHELDYLLWLLGPVATVAAETARVSELEIDVEDVALALLRFDSGALATVSVNFVEPAYRRGCVLVGSDAVARWSWGRDAIELSGREGPFQHVAAAGEFADTYVAVARDFVESVETGRAPQTPCAEGVETIRVAQAIKLSAAEGKRVAP
jgi:predicted dehydrogenase